jgi:hypothetical protein
MTVYIRVKRKFGITARDQSIREFHPGVYEIDDELAKIQHVWDYSDRIANPDDKLKQPVVIPPTNPPRRIISPPLKPVPQVEAALPPLTPDNSAVLAANAAAKAREAVEPLKPAITRYAGARAAVMEQPGGGEVVAAADEKRGPGRPKKTA